MTKLVSWEGNFGHVCNKENWEIVKCCGDSVSRHSFLTLEVEDDDDEHDGRVECGTKTWDAPKKPLRLLSFCSLAMGNYLGPPQNCSLLSNMNCCFNIQCMSVHHWYTFANKALTKWNLKLPSPLINYRNDARITWECCQKGHPKPKSHWNETGIPDAVHSRCKTGGIWYWHRGWKAVGSLLWIHSSGELQSSVLHRNVVLYSWILLNRSFGRQLCLPQL